jgi:hypothetical protein
MDTQAAQLPLSSGGSLEPITFVCWRWTPPANYRSKFSPATVATLRSMIARHYHGPFEMVCVTDRTNEVPQGVRAVQLWDDFKHVPSPHGGAYPSCYRRLKLFSEFGRTVIRTPRFAWIDLDVVITGDITPLFQIKEDFKMYGDTARGTPYNGSLLYNRLGTRPQLWDSFDPRQSPKLGRDRRYIGSDQAWIAVCLGPNEPKFTATDGVYSYRNQILPKGGHLPSGARIVVFHGAHDPWSQSVQARHVWIAKHYR